MTANVQHRQQHPAICPPDAVTIGQSRNQAVTAAGLAATVAQFPARQRLNDLSDTVRQCPSTIVDRDLVREDAGHAWLDGEAHALGLRSAVEDLDVRADHAGGVTWQGDGTLTQGINERAALPAADDRLGPRLVAARGPRLWTP
jgi:hypothetical protein